MNEELMKKVIQYKLNLAYKIVDHLPSNISKEVKKFRQIVTECINEAEEEHQETSAKARKPSNQMKNVTID